MCTRCEDGSFAHCNRIAITECAYCGTALCERHADVHVCGDPDWLDRETMHEIKNDLADVDWGLFWDVDEEPATDRSYHFGKPEKVEA